mmetsp:Transcript_58391/g.153740  ORF Transcript_58391/g.153740 Transcript_58391/m.153740 type:complete len:90 (+) Transcript_58391:3076-3345(+)
MRSTVCDALQFCQRWYYFFLPHEISFFNQMDDCWIDLLFETGVLERAKIRKRPSTYGFGYAGMHLVPFAVLSVPEVNIFVLFFECICNL